MLRRLVPMLVAAACAGCFNFDAAYEQYCDAGHCDAGGGGAGGGAMGGGAGGGAMGGGTGGGAMGGGAGGGAMGGGAGGGAMGGGAGGGGGTADAGCPLFLCPELDWKSTQSSDFYIVAPGLMTESLANFRVLAAFSQGTSSAPFQQYEFRFVDGGVSELNRTSILDGRVEVRQLRGVSMDNYWYTYRTYATHYDELTTQRDDYGACVLPDGGTTDPWHWAVAPVTTDEVWLVGYPMSICHWTASGGLTTVVEPGGWPNAYLEDVYRAPDGRVFVVGGDYDSNNSQSTCIAFREDGTPVSVPPIVDTYYYDGCASIGGAGTEVYVLARSNSNQRGEILALGPDGGFNSVYTAPFRLAQLNVAPSGEVWAVGQSPSRAVYFDGGSWGVVPLPTTELRSDVRWENINATADGLILSGYEFESDGGNTAVVNTYRFFGH